MLEAELKQDKRDSVSSTAPTELWDPEYQRASFDSTDDDESSKVGGTRKYRKSRKSCKRKHQKKIKTQYKQYKKSKTNKSRHHRINKNRK